jgi:hypothetical protein
MKKLFIFAITAALAVAMAAPASAATPALKPPNLPKIPAVKVKVEVKVTDNFWSSWFQKNPIFIK